MQAKDQLVINDIWTNITDLAKSLIKYVRNWIEYVLVSSFVF